MHINGALTLVIPRFLSLSIFTCFASYLFPRKILLPVQATEVSHFTTRLTLNLQPSSTSLKWVHELDHWYNVISSQFGILGLPVTWIAQYGAISCFFSCNAVLLPSSNFLWSMKLTFFYQHGANSR